MRNIRLTVAYDGTDFRGFQIQEGQRTVQGVLEEAIERITGTAARIAGAGRTDAGVHATGQVVSFPTVSTLTPEALQQALNAVIPEDMAVLEADEVSDGFHARYSARGRRYRYTIWNARVRSVRERRFAFHWRSPLDVEAMDAASKVLIGRNDFSAFAGTLSGRDRPTNMVRTLYWLNCWREGERVLLDTAADAFLPHMVRNLVGTLIPVGMGQRTPLDVQTVLAGRDRQRAGPTAPPEGLCLTKVWYGDAPKEHECRHDCKPNEQNQDGMS